MRESLLLRIRVPPDPVYHEFLVSRDLSVDGAARLMARLAPTSFLGCPSVDDDAELMLVEGPHAGMLLDRRTPLRDLVAYGVLSDGAELVLL